MEYARLNPKSKASFLITLKKLNNSKREYKLL